jgi:hypothetical protein
MGILHQDGAMKLFVIWSEPWSLILGVSMAWCLNVAALVAGFEGT